MFLTLAANWTKELAWRHPWLEDCHPSASSAVLGASLASPTSRPHMQRPRANICRRRGDSNSWGGASTEVVGEKGSISMMARLDGCGMEKEKDDGKQLEVENGRTKRGEVHRVSRETVVRHLHSW